jgi:RHS repeat-associated protein
VSKISVHPEHMRRSGGKLSEFGGKLADGGQKLETAGQNLVEHASGDRSGIGAVVAKAMGRGIQVTGKVFSEGGRVVEGAGQRLHTTAGLYEEADNHGASLLNKHHPGAKGTPRTRGGGPRSATKVSSGGKRRNRSARQHVGGEPRSHAVPPKGRTTTKDPVDLATGEVLLTQTDVELPGALPLVLGRTHVSSYRVGQRFGRSWASTVDRRLEIDEQGVVHVADDGTLLVYPTPPEDGTAVLPQEGRQNPLRRDQNGYVISDPEYLRELHFTTDGVLTEERDRAGHRIEIERDPAGIPTAVSHSGGYRIDIETTDGLVTALRVGETVVQRFGYDEDGNLAEVIDPAGLAQRFTYDSDDRLTEWVDRNGMWYRYHYDAQGRCVFAEGAGGQLNCTLEYGDLTTRATDSLGHTTVYVRNDANQVVRIIDPIGAETVSEWDRHDRLLSRTDPLGRTTRYEYSDDGDLIRVTRPDGSQILAEHNGLRLPVTIVDPDGATWRREYDQVGNLLSVTDPAGAVTRFGYDDHNHLAAVTDPLGASTTVECDGAGNPLRVTNPLGGTTVYTRDALGRVESVTDAAGATVRLEWTVDGKLSKRTNADGTVESWSYDGEGNEVAHTDALGRQTRTEYGGFDVPIAQIDAAGNRTAFTYDTELQLVAVTNPAGLVWRYDYDAAGNKIGETDFNGRVLAFAYDSARQLVSRTNGIGQTTTFQRDALGRVVQQQSADGASTFAYDAADRLVRATNSDADVVLTRDVMGRITAETCNGRSVFSAYDAAGRRIRRMTPTGADTQWEFDAAGQATALRTAGHTIEFDYDTVGHETVRRLGQVTLSQTWHANHRLHTQALTGPPSSRGQHLIQRRAYTYRDDGAITNIVDQLGGVRHYDLDDLGRVIGVQGRDHQESYGYDSAGNLAMAGDETRTRAGTLLRTAGALRYEHDGQGRVVTRSSRTLSGQVRNWQYAWNSEDRLVAVSTPDGAVWRYTYDALGRRVGKYRLGPDNVVVEQVDFTWDGFTLAEQTHSGGSATTWNYQPGGFAPLTQTERMPLPQGWVDREFYGIITDLIGTPTELVDTAGNLAWRQLTTLWGAPLAMAAQPGYCPLRFPGQYHDAETGQNYNFFRYYDSEGGEYSAPDPLGLYGGPRPHGYVPNPLSWLDPLGLIGRDCNGRKVKDDEITLYRAVKNDELADIHGRRGFTNPPGIESKYFSYSAEGAAAYGREAYQNWPHEGPYTIVRTTVKRDLIPDDAVLPHVADVKGGLGGVALPSSVLPHLGRPRILPYSPLPPRR